MRKYLMLSTLALVLVPATAVAQERHAEGEEHSAQGVNSIKPLYEQFRGWLIASAEQMPEEQYSFQPTPEVRTFGMIIGHVANASYMFCSGARGEDNPNSADFEELASKAHLVEELKKAFAFCDGAYEMAESKAMEETTFFGQQNTRLWVLNFNATHNAEHYGNIVTYMRINGLTPPSSQGN